MIVPANPRPIPPNPWPPDPDRDVVLDAHLMRALAHPMRTKLIGALRERGPATATVLASQLGVNTGVTSYHLRHLANVGLVVEDRSRGSARERWWRSAYDSSYLDAKTVEEDPDTANTYLRALAQVYSEHMFRFVDALPTMPKAWVRAADMSDYSFHLTAAQLQAMVADLRAVLHRYRSAEEERRRRGARSVSVQIQAFPRDAG
jgi:DNA-binding transcriptional ArsR family regulator